MKRLIRRLCELITVLLGLRRELDDHARRLQDADRRLDAAEAELQALRAEARLGKGAKRA